MSAGETEMLLFALERARAQFAWKCGGLDADALHRAHPPSSMTLGGLLKHLAAVEAGTAADFTGEPPGKPWDSADARVDPEWEWRSSADDSAEELYALWQGAVEHSKAALAQVLIDGGLDQPAKVTTNSAGDAPNLRRLVVDLHDEYSRHVGHADLFREAVDGLVGEDPPR